jgi:hypothetical protein
MDSMDFGRLQIAGWFCFSTGMIWATVLNGFSTGQSWSWIIARCLGTATGCLIVVAGLCWYHSRR